MCTVAVCDCLSRVYVIVVSWSRMARTVERMSAYVGVAWPPMAVITSPGLRPACFAGLGGAPPRLAPPDILPRGGEPPLAGPPLPAPAALRRGGAGVRRVGVGGSP